MDMKAVESTNIKSAGYDPTTETMQVEFLSGLSYSYAKVTPDEWSEFEKTFDGKEERAGKYFSSNFRFAKKGTKIE